MYSAAWKHLSLAVMVFVLLMAGMALADHGLGQGFVVCWLVGIASLLAYNSECKNQGAQPLRTLKSGREYRVEAVLPDTVRANNRKVARLVVSWHVDFGHFEFRLADIERDRLERVPVVGDALVGQNMEYEGGMFYRVHSYPGVSGISS